MAYETILYQKEDGVATVTLNRPHRLNSLCRQLVRELLDVCDEMERDSQVRVAIFTGAPRPDGRPCFCSGDDLNELAERAKTEGLTIEGVSQEIRPVWHRIETFPKPTIAAIDGVCCAGGLVLAMCCDLRVVSETARIADLHIKNLGVIGGDGPGVYLARLVGVSAAKEFMFLQDFIDGKEASRIGLANRVFPPEQLLDGAKEMARKIAGMRAAAIRLCKESINATSGLDLDQALAYAYKCNALLETTEGARAFAEGRAPKFTD